MLPTAAQFRHYPNGPVLNVTCCGFVPRYEHQVRALKKDVSGWHSIATTAYCLQDCKIDISSYINDCVTYALDDVCESMSPVSVFFRVARVYKGVRNSYTSALV